MTHFLSEFDFLKMHIWLIFLVSSLIVWWNKKYISGGLITFRWWFIRSDHFNSTSVCWKIVKCVEKQKGQSRQKLQLLETHIKSESRVYFKKRVKFSPWIFEIFDICLHTRPLYGQNLLKFIDQHLAQSSTSVLFQKNKIFIL